MKYPSGGFLLRKFYSLVFRSFIYVTFVLSVHVSVKKKPSNAFWLMTWRGILLECKIYSDKIATRRASVTLIATKFPTTLHGQQLQKHYWFNVMAYSFIGQVFFLCYVVDIITKNVFLLAIVIKKAFITLQNILPKWRTLSIYFLEIRVIVFSKFLE